MRVRLREELRRRGAVYLILFISLIPSSLAFWRARQNVEAHEAVRFEERIRYIEEALGTRMDSCIRTLYGIRGLFDASESVEPAEWSKYVRSIRFEEPYLSVLDIGYARRVMPGQMAAHGDQMRRRRLPHASIFPEGNRPDYFPIVHLDRVEGGETNALGFDLWTVPSLQGAMAQARDQGASAATGRLNATPGNAKDETGFVIFLPVYQGGVTPATVEERRAVLAAFVFASFRAAGLWQQILGSSTSTGVDFEVYDSPSMTPDHLLYDEDGHLTANPAVSVNRRLSRVRRLDVAGQTWTLHFSSLPAFEAETPRYIPYLILLGALLINAALVAVAWVQARARGVAERLSEDLRKSQERLLLVERATNDAIWDWDLTANRIERNAAARRLLGCPVEGVSDEFEWWQSRIHPEDRPGILASVKALMAGTDEFWAGEYRFARSDGTQLTLIDRAVLVRDKAGRPVRMIGSMLDITERLKIEEEKREALRLFETLVNHTPEVAVQIIDREGRVLLWNTASERLYGYTVGEIKGRRLQDTILAPDEVAVFEQRLEQLWQTHLPATPGEWAVRSQKGDRRHVYSTLFPILREGRCEAACCMDVDITARKATEHALEAEKERLAITLRSIAEGVIATDTSARIVMMNKVAETLTGCAQAAALGRPLMEVFQVVDSRTRQPGDDPVARVLGAEGTLELSRCVATLVQPMGEWPIAYSAAPIQDQRGELMGVVLVFRDISGDQRAAEERLRASKLESVGLLAGGIAHDFNNILTVIIGNISFIKLSLNPPMDIRPLLDEAEKASLRARDLTRQLLTFARGGAPIKQPTSLPVLIRESTDFALSGSNVRRELAFVADLWTVEADPGQLSQVIENLVINAVQAMPGGGTLRVRAENVVLEESNEVALPAGSYVRVLVEDEGQGIPREQLARIFDPYFTTKPSGTGLGLATVYSIVNRHGGRITVNSAVGVGTTFRIYLPASMKPALPVPGNSRAMVRGQGRVLVMDDDDLIRNLAGNMLRHLGYQSETAADGEEALSLYVQARESGQPFDVVIIDLTIPGGMGGRETMERLLAIDPKVKAIVSSGYSNDPIMADHRAYGFVGVMAKPYKIQDLAKLLKEVVTGDGNPAPVAPV